MLPARLRFGAFIAPFHPIDENPTLAIQRDLELVELLDQLGYDEAWIGEHHSAAYELIASPEVFIAAAAERTKHIRLGTGVKSLPYHHPFVVAETMAQLDHMTRGRVMFGAGPGALPSDARMFGMTAGGIKAQISLFSIRVSSALKACKRPSLVAAYTTCFRFA